MNLALSNTDVLSLILSYSMRGRKYTVAFEPAPHRDGEQSMMSFVYYPNVACVCKLWNKCLNF